MDVVQRNLYLEYLYKLTTDTFTQAGRHGRSFRHECRRDTTRRHVRNTQTLVLLYCVLKSSGAYRPVRTTQYSTHSIMSSNNLYPQVALLTHKSCSKIHILFYLIFRLPLR